MARCRHFSGEGALLRIMTRREAMEVVLAATAAAVAAAKEVAAVETEAVAAPTAAAPPAAKAQQLEGLARFL